MDKELKTSDARRRAVANYEKKNDRINVIFPAGTKDRIAAAGFDSMGAFIKLAVEEKLQSIEKKTE